MAGEHHHKAEHGASSTHSWEITTAAWREHALWALLFQSLQKVGGGKLIQNLLCHENHAGPGSELAPSNLAAVHSRQCHQTTQCHSKGPYAPAYFFGRSGSEENQEVLQLDASTIILINDSFSIIKTVEIFAGGKRNKNYPRHLITFVAVEDDHSAATSNHTQTTN